MNRKNLTAAVLAGLAGAAGLAGTAQAVNLNPDGLGQVLIYPYYTANDGNNTLLSVVNTTENAKAVKVRFLEGFNSREVLDFNLYMSHHDVWTAAILNNPDLVAPDAQPYETDTFLLINDDSCTVPYLYEDRQITLDDGSLAGLQPFLNLAYTGKKTDGGPTSDTRVHEGHFEMIEMGTITPGSDTEKDITHATNKDGVWEPGDCEQLVDNWTDFASGTDGIWYTESLTNEGQAKTDTLRNSGGLFGGAAIVNPNRGAMWSYDARAVQGFDSTADGIHYIPGTIFPSLNSGNEKKAWIFFGVPQNQAIPLQYEFGVDAVSAVFMHEFTMNEYTTSDTPAEAATEWVVTFPTKNFYADPYRLDTETGTSWRPSLSSGVTGVPIGSCNLWSPGDPYPLIDEGGSEGPAGGLIDDNCGDAALGTECGPFTGNGEVWNECVYVAIPFNLDDKARNPFTELYGDEDCEVAQIETYDRDERTFREVPGGRPPTVSPAPPDVTEPGIFLELCNEVNVLRFGERVVFGSLEDVDGESLLITVSEADQAPTDAGFTDGWAWINFYNLPARVDDRGLVGLPVTGFAAYQFNNGFVEGPEGEPVKAFYGATFQHKGNVRKIRVEEEIRLID